MKRMELEVRMNTYDHLFETGHEREDAEEILIRELHEFEGHPFRVVDDENMEELIQSIRERGILVRKLQCGRREKRFL